MQTKKIKIWLWCLIIIGLYRGLASGGVDDPRVGARKVLESFCDGDFQAEETGLREQLVAFTPQGKKAAQKLAGEEVNPWVVQWDYYPYYIVTSYKILDINVRRAQGTGRVRYEQIGESRGHDVIISNAQSNNVVKYNLVKRGGTWKILDPPKPRVSIKSIINIYDKYFESLEQKWIENKALTQVQRDYYYGKQKAYNALKGLYK